MPISSPAVTGLTPSPARYLHGSKGAPSSTLGDKAAFSFCPHWLLGGHTLGGGGHDEGDSGSSVEALGSDTNCCPDIGQLDLRTAWIELKIAKL